MYLPRSEYITAIIAVACLLIGRPWVGDTYGTVRLLLGTLGLEETEVTAEGRSLLEDEEELFVIEFADGEGYRLGLSTSGSRIAIDALDDALLLVTLLSIIDLREGITLLGGGRGEDIFIEAKARGEDGDGYLIVMTSSEKSLVNSCICMSSSTVSGAFVPS